MRLVGSHAVVTGGGTGIGAAIAHALAERGAGITLIGRTADTLKTTATRIGARHIVADMADPVAATAAIDAARGGLGPVSILVANAGAAATSPLEGTDDATWRAMIGANLDTTFHAIRAALPDVRQARHGRIIAVASTAALKGYAYAAAYAAAKHGVVGLIRSLALELSDTQATANALCPGFTDTDMAARSAATIARATGRDIADAAHRLAEFSPQRRLIDPAEVAAAALWLCEPSSRGINGQAISISGGETM